MFGWGFIMAEDRSRVWAPELLSKAERGVERCSTTCPNREIGMI